MRTRRSIWFLAAMALGLMLAQPWAPAAEEQEQPKKAEEQAPPAPAPPPALALPPGVACNNTPAAASNSGMPKKLNPCMGIPEAIAEGRTTWMQTGCNGCHGMGGGGMGPSVMDDLWKFGGDDGTLFKLIKGQIPNQTMPAVFGAVLTEEQVWKIIAWIRSIYKGDASQIVW
ncbi:MAG TPA: c-type cytochrome [Candidatus Methylomirabilis sp.]|nr:c-type cytochrome [Candidatus Methylomirabilis sp.]